MDLREQQDILAKLFTDPAYRQEQTGRSERSTLPLSEAECREVEHFSESLGWKRLREVEKLLPLTRAAMGRTFETEFRSFYPSFNPQTVKRHLEDAVAFCDHLRRQSQVSQGARNAARFEAAKLRFFGFERKVAFCSPGPESGIAGRRLSFAVWFRIGKRIRYFSR